MNPRIGWAVAAVGIVGASWAWGWRGALLAVSAAVFVMLLQFTLALRTMRAAAQAPVGRVADVQRFARALRPGLRLVSLVRATGSLGEAVSDQPEVWRWRDGSGAQIDVTFVQGRVTTWSVAEAPPP